MAELCFKDAYVLVGTTTAPTNLSDHVRSVTINYAAEMLDKTAMTDDSRSRLAGLKDWSVTIEFNQDYATGSVDATLFDMVGSSATRVLVKPTTAIVGAGNPRFYGNALLESYPPVGGSVGDLATVSVTFQGDGDLTRSVAST